MPKAIKVAEVSSFAERQRLLNEPALASWLPMILLTATAAWLCLYSLA